MRAVVTLVVVAAFGSALVLVLVVALIKIGERERRNR